MFGVSTTILAMIALAGFAAAALFYALLYGRIEQQATAEKRLGKVAEAPRGKDGKAEPGSARRRTVQDTLKDIEVKQKHKASQSTNPPLSLRLQQSGLTITTKQFYVYSALLGLGLFVVCFILGMSLPLMVGVAFVGAFGLPRYVVNFLRRRRQNAFTEELANAVEVIVRGVKAGLPLNDCLRMIASEAKEPVRSEFKAVMDSVQLGIPIDEAIGKMYERVPLPETNFFAIVIAIQSKAGGNLSEALGNLAKVLRERKKMRAKIQAMSMEAKSSATIIGALPIIVATLVYLTSPDYIMVLFTTTKGHFVLGGSALCMGIGVFVMKKMISFDF
ncbi:type II secretion system F family protein [Oryzibacter oryziterrae]|uniref:type II secretion system F family protein n=1 Tax=Oryzibacter oryziterrae TaxID=2766474 RepID=UPI001F403C05|nr:type II secretion system F family protein [Oryzibacter oryziterrae]